ncbi:MAG: GNAT family N-acetyltransferase [Bacilli bacterium]|nr:GNAT family N-acetyltransferase [Bacilli bacterium]MBR1818328.1 GNAT family N-acetyltransferase [Bacilli bacterium]
MIREIEEKDFEKVYQLGELLHPNYRNLYPMEKMLKEPYFHVLVYEENREILGFLSYTDLKVSIDILDVVVEKLHRRNKIGTNLLDYAITSSTPGCEIYIEVDTKNEPAISLYDKFGFEIVGKREKYYQENDAYVMKRVI